MDPDSTSHLIFVLVVLVVLILLSAFFSATETAFLSVNKIRLKNKASEGNKRAKLVLDLSEKYSKLISTVLIGNNIVNIGASAIATVLFVKALGDGKGATVSTIVTTVVVLIFGEITPKTLAKEYPERFAMFSAPALRILMLVLTPINFLFELWKRLLGLIVKPNEDKGITEDELLTMVEEAQNEGELDDDEGELIKNAIEFDDIEVVDIHTNRVDVVGIDVTATYDEIKKVFRESGFSRLPVYKETIDHIIGILNQKDFSSANEQNFKIKNAMYEPVFVIPSMKISELLPILQKKRSHIAIITDEYGGTVGIVTLEDIIEELVGEIYDEHDEVIEHIIKLADDEYKVLASTDLDDMFEEFDMDEDIDIPTVGGWVMENIGDIPRVGDEFDYKNLHVKVTACKERHVTEINVKILPKEIENEEE